MHKSVDYTTHQVFIIVVANGLTPHTSLLILNLDLVLNKTTMNNPFTLSCYWWAVVINKTGACFFLILCIRHSINVKIVDLYSAPHSLRLLVVPWTQCCTLLNAGHQQEDQLHPTQRWKRLHHFSSIQKQL